MKVTTFTDTMIKKLKPEDKKYIRGEGNGFTIRVMPSGAKSWLYIYAIDGKRREMNLGSYPDVTLETARNRFEDAKKQVKNGIDPLAVEEARADARRKAPTVAKLITEYIEKHAKPTKRSWYEDERILNKDALAVWGNRKAADIKKRDVVLLLESIIERGSPGSANSNFKIIRKMFRFAVQRDILEHSPCDGVVMPAPLNRGDRVLNESEIKTLWSRLDTCHASPEIMRAIRLILTTAQRPGEVIGMHSSEIDGQWWTIPAERAKNGKAHRVYLTATALELIGDTTGKGYIFPGVQRKQKEGEKPKPEKPMGRLSISQVVSRNLTSPVLVNGKPVFDKKGEQVTENKLGVTDFDPHDLRRTAATFMSQIGFMDEIIDAVLNHTTVTTRRNSRPLKHGNAS
jgi:integrase